MSTPLVFGFDEEHPLGYVCTPRCAHCVGAGMTDAKRNELKEYALLIVRPSTFDAWRKSLLENGGEVSDPHYPFYYEVATD